MINRNLLLIGFGEKDNFKQSAYDQKSSTPSTANKLFHNEFDEHLKITFTGSTGSLTHLIDIVDEKSFLLTMDKLKWKIQLSYYSLSRFASPTQTNTFRGAHFAFITFDLADTDSKKEVFEKITEAMYLTDRLGPTDYSIFLIGVKKEASVSQTISDEDIIEFAKKNNVVGVTKLSADKALAMLELTAAAATTINLQRRNQISDESCLNKPLKHA